MNQRVDHLLPYCTNPAPFRKISDKAIWIRAQGSHRKTARHRNVRRVSGGNNVTVVLRFDHNGTLILPLASRREIDLQLK